MIAAFVATVTISAACFGAIEEHFGGLLVGVVVVRMDLPSNEVKIGPGIIYLSEIETRTFIHSLIHAWQMKTHSNLEVLEAHSLGHHWLELQAIKAWRGFYFRYGPECDW